MIMFPLLASRSILQVIRARLLNDGLLRLLTSLPTGIVTKCKRKAIRKKLETEMRKPKR